MSDLISPSQAQTLKQAFAENFLMLAQQKKSKLSNTAAVETTTFNGKYLFTTRVGKTEMVEKNDQYATWDDEDFKADQRKQKFVRFAKSFKLDAKDVAEMITDPNSVIYQQLEAAFMRLKDRSVLTSAVGDVLTGDMESTATTTTAAEDGVITIDCKTSGINYAKVVEAHQNFINNDIAIGDEMSSGYVLAITGKENSNLMMEDKFINSDYTKYYSVDAGKVMSPTGIGLATFAGSVTGDTKLNPIVPEASTVRKCVLMAPNAIKFGVRNVQFVMEKISGSIESYRIGVSCHLSALRTDGARVQVLETTI